MLPEKGMGLDIGGIGKEYAVDRIFEMARAAGLENVLVNFGRDLRAHAPRPRVALGVSDSRIPAIRTRAGPA